MASNLCHNAHPKYFVYRHLSPADPRPKDLATSLFSGCQGDHYLTGSGSVAMVATRHVSVGYCSNDPYLGPGHQCLPHSQEYPSTKMVAAAHPNHPLLMFTFTG